MIAVTGGRVVGPHGVSPDAGVLVDAGVVVDMGPIDENRSVEVTTVDVDGAWVIPGLVDIHVHGGAGHWFAEGGERATRAAAAHHHRGTTTLLASLASAPLAVLEDQIAGLRPLVGPGPDPARRGWFGGLHLEGPFLAHARCGAHDPAHLRAPAPAEVARLLTAAGPDLAAMTVAPELDGALDAIGALVDAGAVAAVGHTDADYEQALAGFAAGATLLTHAGNAMAPFHHRAPGPLGAALDAGARCEVIADGVHVHDGFVRSLHRQRPGGVALVTDALAPAATTDAAPPATLGDRPLTVRGGAVWLAGTDVLAGSVLTLADVLARTVAAGMPMVDAVGAASWVPAAAVGLGDRVGRLAPGLAADLLVLDDDLRVLRVMRSGEWLAGDGAGSVRT